MEYKIIFKRIKNFLKGDSRGQSTVEYILLLAILTTVSLGIFRSQLFRSQFIDPGLFFESYKLGLQHAYRHGYSGSVPLELNDSSRYGQDHESYYRAGDTKFFFANEVYPKN